MQPNPTAPTPDPLDGIDPDELADLGYRLAQLLASAYRNAVANAPNVTLEGEAA